MLFSVDNNRGKLYFAHAPGSRYMIEMAAMDGSQRRLLVDHHLDPDIATVTSQLSNYTLHLFTVLELFISTFRNLIDICVGSVGLCVDISRNRLYWVNLDSATMQYYDFNTSKVFKVSFFLLCYMFIV